MEHQDGITIEPNYEHCAMFRGGYDKASCCSRHAGNDAQRWPRNAMLIARSSLAPINVALNSLTARARVDEMRGWPTLSSGRRPSRQAGRN